MWTVKKIKELFEMDVHELGRIANGMNDNRVMFVINRHINYTNVCISKCPLCAFWRDNGYLMSKEELQKKIKEYQRRVEITPKIEQQLKELTRGYTVTKKEYQSLLDKKLQAELAANMEREQKGEQFKILDPAKLPEKPYKPLLFLHVLHGTGFGGFIIYMSMVASAYFKCSKLKTK